MPNLVVAVFEASDLKPKDGQGSASPYVEVELDEQRQRTQTKHEDLNPQWNEKLAFNVSDPRSLHNKTIDVLVYNGTKGGHHKQVLGRVRISGASVPLSESEASVQRYPLDKRGLSSHIRGDIALRIYATHDGFDTDVSPPNVGSNDNVEAAQCPMTVPYIDWLRHQAMQIVAARLAQAEPPLRREVVEYMLDVDAHMFSLRRSKANFNRIMSLLSGITAICRWFHSSCHWRNHVTTCLVHLLFFILVCCPQLILPTIFLYLFVIGFCNFRFKTRLPPHMDARLSQAENAHPDELDEEFDSFPTSMHSDMVSMRYDRLRSIAGRVQTVIGDLATQGERAQSILSWQDPRATAIFIIFALIWAVIIYVTLLQVIAGLVGLYLLVHPRRFRSRLPPVPVNFFKRLPAKSDMLL